MKDIKLTMPGVGKFKFKSVDELEDTIKVLKIKTR